MKRGDADADAVGVTTYQGHGAVAGTSLVSSRILRLHLGSCRRRVGVLDTRQEKDLSWVV